MPAGGRLSASGARCVRTARAVGVGLNIQAASVVIITEPRWKPTMEDQAIARCHRMGQVPTVDVIALAGDTMLGRGVANESALSRWPRAQQALALRRRAAALVCLGAGAGLIRANPESDHDASTHAARWPGPAVTKSGSWYEQSDSATGHRGWKRHPGGIAEPSGTSPDISFADCAREATFGTAAMSARV